MKTYKIQYLDSVIHTDPETNKVIDKGKNTVLNTFNLVLDDEGNLILPKEYINYFFTGEMNEQIVQAKQGRLFQVIADCYIENTKGNNPNFEQS